MMQLYIVYRLLLYRRHWGWTVALVVVCMIVQMSCGPESEALNRWRYNCIGGMLPFGFGLLCARFPMPLDNKLYSALFTIISAIFVFNESMSYYSWFFVPVFICSLGFSLVKLLPLWLLRPLEWMGGISAALFVCHPITRKIFIPISKQGDMYTGLLLYIVASIVLAMMIETFMSMKKK
jgi:peptidoglycan/LPS O-acetylase OafA/YrhL